jgi:hypothetical protein
MLTFTLLFIFILRERLALRTMEDTLRKAGFAFRRPDR